MSILTDLLKKAPQSIKDAKFDQMFQKFSDPFKL